MDELVFLKLGGSLITAKRSPRSARQQVIERLAQEIASARAQSPHLRLLLGHGSGSYGHYEAHKYKVRAGSLADWIGYAATSAAVQELDTLVINALLGAGVPAVPVQPSASAICRDGEIEQMPSTVLEHIIANGAVPVVYGDVAVDQGQGCTIISTEQIFAFLAPLLRPRRIILAGNVAGVYSADPAGNPQAQLIRELDQAAARRMAASLGGADGIDVTGGMASKIALMWPIQQAVPSVAIRLISGLQPGVLQRVLIDPDFEAGTILRR